MLLLHGRLGRSDDERFMSYLEADFARMLEISCRSPPVSEKSR